MPEQRLLCYSTHSWQWALTYVIRGLWGGRRSKFGRYLGQE